MERRIFPGAGTPAYLISDLFYNKLDYVGFRRAVANARRQAAPKEPK